MKRLLKKSADKLLKMGISNVFIYDTEIGFLYQTKKESFYFPVTLKKVTNANGVGAAAIAAIIYARRLHINTEETARLVQSAAQVTMTTYLNVFERMSPKIFQHN